MAMIANAVSWMLPLSPSSTNPGPDQDPARPRRHRSRARDRVL